MVHRNPPLPNCLNKTSPPPQLNPQLIHKTPPNKATQQPPQLFLPINSTTFSTSNTSQPATFLILMVDPDAPSPQNPSFSQILHWLQPGVRLSRSTGSISSPDGAPLAMLSASATETEALVPYQGPQPPSVAPHRYIIMLFRQEDEDDFQLPDAYAGYAGGQNRTLFNASAFVEAAGLARPVAATYFLAGLETSGNGSATYQGGDAAAGIGSNGTTSAGGDNSPSDASSGSATATATPSAPSSGAGRLGVGALIGAVAGAVMVLG